MRIGAMAGRVLCAIALMGVSARTTVAQAPTARIVRSANAFLATLDHEARSIHRPPRQDDHSHR